MKHTAPSVRVTVFHCGGLYPYENQIVSDGSGERRFLPLLGFVIEHPEYGPVLVDAPLGARGIEGTGLLNAWAFQNLARALWQTGWSTADRVREAGFAPETIKTGLLTHMHTDHTGGIPQFPATVWRASAAEWRHALERSSAPWWRRDPAYRRDDFECARSKPIEYDGPWVEPFGPCGDVFGDGSVLAVPLPGHSPGHQGFLVRGEAGDVLLCGDAIFDRRQAESRARLGIFPRLISADDATCGETIERLRRFRKRRPEVTLLPSHDFAAGDACFVGPVRVV